jgi:hypothetical protein
LRNEAILAADDTTQDNFRFRATSDVANLLLASSGSKMTHKRHAPRWIAAAQTDHEAYFAGRKFLV